MMRNKILGMTLVWLVVLGVLHGKNVRITCDKVGAFIYVDGKKKSIIGNKPRVLSLSKGSHQIKVVKPIDEAWQESESKQITVKDTTMELFFRQFNIEMKPEPKNPKTDNTQSKKQRRFVKSEHSVKDIKTGREWQDIKTLSSLVKNWDEAKKYCENLVLDRHDDWYVPSYEVFQTIIDHGEVNAALVDAFEYLSEGFYWSSTEFSGNPKQAARVYLELGCTDSNINKSEKYKVVCIREK